MSRLCLRDAALNGDIGLAQAATPIPDPACSRTLSRTLGTLQVTVLLNREVSGQLNPAHATCQHRHRTHRLIPSLHVRQPRHLEKSFGYSVYSLSLHGEHLLEPFL